MKKIILIIFFLQSIAYSQTHYTITVNTSDAWSGNLFFKRGGTQPKPVVIIDSSGAEIFSENWGMKGYDFKVNYNNKLSYFDRASGRWFIMDSLSNEIDSISAKNGYTADNHDFLALPNGNYVLFCYDSQPYAMDTIVAGGDPNAVINEALIIQELDSNHNVIFEWKSWDHFHITDNLSLSPWTGSQLTFMHTNAIDIDFDGNFIFSSRNLDEITKIHRTSGEVIWRFGGSQNDFTFLNDYPFTRQHSIRSLGNNRYLLYDNGNNSSQYTGTNNFSRAVEYELDTILMTATKVWEFIHPDSLYTPSTGGVQRLPNGNTLINFGNLQALNMGSIITEVDTNNQIVFQLEYDNGYNLYRAQKFDWFFITPTYGCTDTLACNYDPSINIDDGSCYYPANVQITQNGPSLDVIISNSSFSSYNYLWNTLETTQNIIATNTGLFWCIVTDPSNCTSDTAFINVSNIPTFVNEYNTLNKINNIFNIQGNKSIYRKNTPLLYIYDNGRIEKKIIIE